MRNWTAGVALLWACTYCLFAKDSVDAKKPVRASVCGVLRHPERYDGRIVQIRGNVSMGFESFILTDYADPSCSGTIWLEYADEIGAAPNGRAALKVLRNAELRHFEHVTGVEGSRATSCSNGHESKGHDVVATLIGRVDHETRQCGKSGGKRGSLCGYGHMGQWKTQLEIQSVFDIVVGEN